VIVLAILATPAAAQTWKADFNMPSGTQMGPDWIETVGNMVIASNAGQGGASGQNKMVHVSAKGDYALARARLTFVPVHEDPGQRPGRSV
jgi:hypothetical protein